MISRLHELTDCVLLRFLFQLRLLLLFYFLHAASLFPF